MGDKLQECYKIIRDLTETVINSDRINGLILESPTGLGKTYNCVNKLKSMGLNKGEDYEVLRGYTTPLELYQFLYKNKCKVILMDDIPSVFDDEVVKGILLSALYNSEGEEREVSYLTSSNKLEVPDTFVFGGSVIWCVNYLPSKVNNIISRCLYYPFEFSYDELIVLMGEVCEEKGIPSEVMSFIKEYTDESVRLDLRLPEKINELRNELSDWRVSARELLRVETDEVLKVLLECLREAECVKGACELFKERTGLSRRTFFRKKAELISY